MTTQTLIELRKLGSVELPNHAHMDFETFTPLYTADQLLAYRYAVIEACAKEADHWYEINKTHRCGDYIAAAIRGLK
jgi:hypothetical protein